MSRDVLELGTGAAASEQNALPNPIQLDLGYERKGGFLLRVRPPDGEWTVAPSLPITGGISRFPRVVLPPGSELHQKLLLNDRYNFDKPGVYEVSIQLQSPVVTGTGTVVEIPTASSFSFRVLGRDDQRLSEVCDRLADTIVNAYDAAEEIDAANALRRVGDPVAIAWIQWVLSRTDHEDASMFDGLVRIGGEGAEAALVQAATSTVQERAQLAGTALSRLRASK